MRGTLRREIRLLRLWSTASLLAVIVIAVAGFGRQTPPRTLGEITVERINVVDADGKVRLVISNKDRFPMTAPIDGKVGTRQGRATPGMLFYNDEGEENGGLSFGSYALEGHKGASAALLFDQYKQDQTVGLMYSEDNGQRTAGLHVWDRPDESIAVLIDRLDAIRKLPEAERAAATAKVRADYPDRHRVFVGKTRDRSAVVTLSDPNGKPRLNLKVDASGAASIEFLDETGKVIERLPKGD